jgi:DNA adenine methylase
MAVAKLRAPVQWFGGKGNLRARIIPLIPDTKVYCEPYGGGGSILCAREPAPVEVYNDLNGDLVNLFRVLQDPRRFRAFQHRIEHTLYSREEFVTALNTLADAKAKPADRAWAFFTAQNQGMSGIAKSPGNWSRVFISNRGMADNANSWLMRLAHLPDWHQRFARVQIDNRCALQVIGYWDSPETTFYLDPPYVHATRQGSEDYRHEANDAHHGALVDALLDLKGAAVLSGYRHPIYKPLEGAGWESTNIRTAAYAAGRTRNSGLQGKGAALAKVPRTETIWRNRKAVKLTALAAAA